MATELINNATEQRSIFYNTVHVCQRYKWDCGITCVLMVISERDRTYFTSNFSMICRKEEINESTWTIDLCYLLKRFNVKHCMYTKKIGINSQLNSSIIVTEKDIQRVRKRLKDASSLGVRMIETTLPTEELLNHVKRCGPAIVLVNARLLACDWCKRNKLASELRSILGGTYQGHYITVVGRSQTKVLYLDPASHHTCATTARGLDAARSAPGTDHDVILVNKM
ncbi:protein GUCD1 [Aricia agestis]|uniref:protein GUCD1 n=1 Tax=Aricia agestis TaxID=91739 RepID=UPI001C20A315|nr:protein GUCD1 [Aricia agestis]